MTIVAAEESSAFATKPKADDDKRSNHCSSIVGISYNSLVSLAPTDDSLIDAIARGFGSGDGCLGIVCITDLPATWSAQRQRILPLARRLASLPASELNACVRPEAFYSVGWSHGKEQFLPGKPDFAKGSFYANPLTDDKLADRIQRLEKMNNSGAGGGVDDRDNDDNNNGENDVDKLRRWAEREPCLFAPNVWPDASLPALRPAFCEMGRSLVEVGRMVAAVCDAYCRRCGGVETKFHETLSESLNICGRLLHYFDQSSSSEETAGKGGESVQQRDASGNSLWCGWHKDHCSLTGLVPAMYLNESGEEVESPNAAAGLYVQDRSGRVVRVKLPSGVDVTRCACFQIGEACQIESGGLLRATPHAVVCPPGNGSGVTTTTTRETMAVFLEPNFDYQLVVPPPREQNLQCAVDEGDHLPPSIMPLRARYKPGQSFGDFHNATVKAFALLPTTVKNVAAD